MDRTLKHFTGPLHFKAVLKKMSPNEGESLPMRKKQKRIKTKKKESCGLTPCLHYLLVQPGRQFGETSRRDFMSHVVLAVSQRHAQGAELFYRVLRPLNLNHLIL